MKPTKENPQKKFFEILKHHIKEDVNMAYVLSDLLNISVDAVYRRLRGQKELSFSEISILCKEYNISFDTFLGISNSHILFKHFSLENNFDLNYLNYLNSLKNSLQNLLNSHNYSVIFAAMDIPFVHLVNYPELTAFKVHTWRKKEIQGDYGNVLFDPNNILNDKVNKLYTEIAEYYKRISSSEIWTLDTINYILKLIEYYNELGDFKDKETPLLLCDQVKHLMENLRDVVSRAESSNFLHNNKFNFYLSEISLENNYVYIENENTQSVFIKLYTINSIATQNKTFCNETKMWLDNLINKSTPLTGTSQKQGYLFFKHALNKIELTRTRIEQGAHLSKAFSYFKGWD
jgi:hypothetical protein